MIRASHFRRPALFLLALLVLLAAFRAVLPFLVRDYVDRQLNSHPGYSGHVDDVHLALWRGAYEIRGMEVRQDDSASREPLFRTDRMEISLLWSDLVDGRVQARIRVFEPKVTFAPAHAGGAAQTGKGPDWVGTLNALAPAGIDRFETVDGQVHYYDPYKDPPVDVYLDHVDAVLTNLGDHPAAATAQPPGQGTRVATLKMHALAVGQGNVDLDLNFAPHEKQPDFHLRLRLIQLQVQRLRDFLRAYTVVDPKSGTLDVVAELDAHDGGVQGYLKPLFHDLQLIRGDQLKEEKDPVHFVVDAVGSVFNLLFQNQSKDQLATVIPIRGRLDQPGVDVAAALGNLVRNAVVKAFQPTFESKDGGKGGDTDKKDKD